MFIRRIYTSCLLAIASVAFSGASALAGEDDGPKPKPPPPPPTPNEQLEAVVTHLRLWLTGLLGVGATLMLTAAGWLYMTAGGNPTQIEKAKTAFRSALVGYALAALAPVLVGVLKGLTA